MRSFRETESPRKDTPWALAGKVLATEILSMGIPLVPLITVSWKFLWPESVKHSPSDRSSRKVWGIFLVGIGQKIMSL
jgi:hypothetical protein